MYNQPFGNAKSYTKAYYDNAVVEMKDVLESRKFMLCFTFTLSKGKKQREVELFENASKKY